LKVEQLLTEQKDGWTTVRLWLDRLFSLQSDLPSTLKRIKQTFDQKSGEHVIYLEYRVKAPYQSAMPVKPKIKGKTGKPKLSKH